MPDPIVFLAILMGGMYAGFVTCNNLNLSVRVPAKIKAYVRWLFRIKPKKPKFEDPIGHIIAMRVDTEGFRAQAQASSEELKRLVERGTMYHPGRFDASAKKKED